MSDPLQYACPACRATAWRGDTEPLLECAACGARYPVIDGVPHFVSGDDYWGEIPAAAMRELLAAMRERHWREALAQSASPRVRAKAAFIADHRRANWIYDAPLDRRSRVLDVGCGMGSIAAALAPLAGEVVALESVALRVEFCRLRFAEDGLRNVRVVRGDGLHLPFPPQSFDAIVLNGVLEWLGKGQGPDTRGVQRRALQAIRALLRPGGLAVVAIENRFAAGSFRGRIDHSYLSYTALMPRWLADRVTRMRRGYPYDTYTYGHAGYLQLFREAGFDRVRTMLPIWGYNRPDYLVPLAGRGVRRVMVRLLEVSGRRAPRFPRLRRLERRLRLSAGFAEDFLFLARHGGEERRSWLRAHLAGHWRAWGLEGDPARLELVILNRAVPSVLALAGGGAWPQAAIKLAPVASGGARAGAGAPAAAGDPAAPAAAGDPAAPAAAGDPAAPAAAGDPAAGFSPPAAEARALERLQAWLAGPQAGEDGARLRPLVPRLIDRSDCAGHVVTVASCLPGVPVALAPGPVTSSRFLRSVGDVAARGLEWLAAFQRCCDAGEMVLDGATLCAALVGGGRRLGPGGAALEAATLERLRRRWPAAGLRVRRVPQHGDYALSNLLAIGGQLGVVDWERCGRVDHPGFDALHFTSYLALVAVSGRRGWRPAAGVAALLGPGPLGACLRGALAPALARLGLDPDELPLLLATYLLAYAREYGVDRRRRGMMGVVAAQLEAVLAHGGGQEGAR